MSQNLGFRAPLPPKSILAIAKVNPAMPFVGRAMSRQIVSSLNFTIVALALSHIRQLRGVPMAVEGQDAVDVDPLVQKYGNTLDNRNEIDEAARENQQGQTTEETMRAAQGHAPVIKPLELAGQLKVLRDYFARDLDDHAVMRVNPLDPRGGMYKDPYTVGETLEASFVRQLGRQPRVNEAHLRAQAEALNLPFEDVLRVQKQQAESGHRYMRENKAEVLALLHNLEALRSGMTPDQVVLPDDIVPGTSEATKYIVNACRYSVDDADEVELAIPAIRRAGLYVAAEMGLSFERDRWINNRLRGHPDALNNIVLLDGARKDLHKEFDLLVKHPKIRQEINEAVERGARWPTLRPILQPSLPQTGAAAQASATA